MGTSHTEKFIERLRGLQSVATKNKELATKQLFRRSTTFSQLLTVIDGASKLGYISMIFVDPEVEVDGILL